MTWTEVSAEDPRGRELADRHYSRRAKQIGKRGYVPPGARIVLWMPGAVWSACLNQYDGAWRWRNTIFRNETSALSSSLIVSATWLTYDIWEERYGLPSVKLTTEIDVAATEHRRSRRSMPGKCYQMAGWSFVEIRQRKKRKQRHAIWVAPDPALRFDR